MALLLLRTLCEVVVPRNAYNVRIYCFYFLFYYRFIFLVDDYLVNGLDMIRFYA